MHVDLPWASPECIQHKSRVDGVCDVDPRTV